MNELRFVCLALVPFLSVNGAFMHRAAAFAEDSQVPGLSYRVVSSGEACLPYQAILFRAVIQNTSPEPKTIALTAGAPIEMAFRRADGPAGDWRDVQRMRGRPSPPYAKVLASGESLSRDESLVIESGGLYEVKVSMGGFNSVSRILVKTPGDQDQKALDYLREHGVASYINGSLQPQFRAYTRDTIGALVDFVNKYPNSYYADLIKVGLGVAWQKGIYEDEKGADKRTDLGEAEGSLTKAVQSTRNEIQSLARYQLGILALQRRDLIAAKQWLQPLTSLPADSYFKLAADDQIARIGRAALVSTSPKDPIFKVTKELEAMGYDLTLTPEIESKMNSDLELAQRDATLAHADGKITYQQLRQVHADTYKTWVLNNLKPKTVVAP